MYKPENISYEQPERLRPNPPQGGSGVINAPVKIDCADEFKSIIGNLLYIQDITNRILKNLDSIQDQLGNANIEFRMAIDRDSDFFAHMLKQQLLDAVKRGDIKFYFTPNQKETS